MSGLNQVRHGLTAAAVLIRCGALRPVSPSRAVRIADRCWRWGSSPATLASISAIRWPDRVAIIDDAGELTYRDLEGQADALAARLVAQYGVEPGRGVAVMCRNHRGLVEGILAAARIGADVVLVNTELPAHQLGPTLGRHDPAIVLHDEEFAARLAEAVPTVPTLQVWSGDQPVMFDDPPTASPGYRGRITKPGNLVLLTSGTTGAPKAVPRQPHPSAFLGVAASAIGRLGLHTGDTMMVSPPAFHGMGVICLLLGLASGHTVVLHRRFDAGRTAEAIDDHNVTCLVAVPTMLQRLTELPDLRSRTRTLRAVLSGAAQLSPVVANEFMDVVGDVLFNGYGSSEVGIASLATPADLRAAPGTVGRPTLGTSILILDETGHPLPSGQVGHLHIQGDMAFDGYTGGGHKEIRHGHLDTGDMGRLDAEGRLFIEGRSDDMIVSGGENVFPQPIEDALRSHPDIADAAVIGAPDDDFGQRLRAFVVLGTAVLDEDAIREHLRSRLTRYEQPRDFVVLDELPRNATGKVLRKQLATLPGEAQ